MLILMYQHTRVMNIYMNGKYTSVRLSKNRNEAKLNYEKGNRGLRCAVDGSKAMKEAKTPRLCVGSRAETW